MNPFNYATIPFLAFERIVNHLNTEEIFNLALRTDEDVLNRLVGSGFTPRNAVFNVVIATAQKTIECRFEDSEKNFKVSFAEVPDPATKFTIITTHGAAQLLRTLRNVQRLFAGSVSQMTIDLEVLDQETLSGLVSIPCEKLTVSGEAESVMKEGVAEEFSIDSNNGIKVFPTHFPNHGVTGTDLIKIAGETKEIELLESTLTDEDVHKFIRLWLGRTETTTVSLKVFQNRQEVWDKKRLLRGIQFSPYQEGTRDKQFVTGRSETGIPETAEDMSFASDIVRADGLMASILITGTELFFVVWHSPHEIENSLTTCQERKLAARHQIDELRPLLHAATDTWIQFLPPHLNPQQNHDAEQLREAEERRWKLIDEEKRLEDEIEEMETSMTTLTSFL